GPGRAKEKVGFDEVGTPPLPRSEPDFGFLLFLADGFLCFFLFVFGLVFLAGGALWVDCCCVWPGPLGLGGAGVLVLVLVVVGVFGVVVVDFGVVVVVVVVE